MGKRTRIDIFLAQKGMVPSRTKAQDLIKQGLVSVRENMTTRAVLSSSELIDELLAPEIIIQKSSLDKYVSRAGLKMEGALAHLQLQVDGWHALDVGISTGGFTDCLLQRGVASVLGVDVGHNQLSPRLRSDPRIRCLEGVNAREIHTQSEVLLLAPKAGFNLAAIDVSFISLTLVLPSVAELVKPWGFVLALVKPQFEVGPAGLGKGGIVTDESLYAEVEKKMKSCVADCGLQLKDYFGSSIEGKDGNKEFFLFAQKM